MTVFTELGVSEPKTFSNACAILSGEDLETGSGAGACSGSGAGAGFDCAPAFATIPDSNTTRVSVTMVLLATPNAILYAVERLAITSRRLGRSAGLRSASAPLCD